MNSDSPGDRITTASEFEAALNYLLVAAVRNDIDLRGSWVCETDDGHGDWEVMIYELE